MTTLYGPASVSNLLRRSSFTFSSEAELQAGIESVLVGHHVAFEREAEIPGAGRIDFMIGQGYGVEVKIAGSTASVLRQLQGYARSPRIEALLLVTSRKRLAVAMPLAIAGKPLATCYLEPTL